VSSLPAALSTFLPAATASLPRGEADLKITLIWSQGRLFSRRLLRSSRPTEIFQPPQQGFYSVHAHAVAASQKYFSAIHTSPHLTLAFVNNTILHLLLVLCTAVNVQNKN
jgi:hypothetical protein